MTFRPFAFGCFLAAACGAPLPPGPPPSVKASTPPVAADDALPFGVRISGHGPPMILIPGLASSADVWDSTVAHEQARFTCYVLELPGFAGRPALGSGPILPAVRDALAGYIRAHHLDHPVIVGHSLGGFVALDLAITYPDLPGKLVIVDSLPFLPAASNPTATVETMKPITEKIRDAIVHGSDATFIDKEKGILATMITDPAKQELALGWALHSDRAATADAMIELMTTDIRPRLGAIHSPTLVIETWTGWGQPREAIVAAYQQQYAELRGVKHVVAETAKHFVMYDDPTLLFSQLDAFLP